MNTSDPNLPNYTRPEAMAVRDDLTLLSDELAGTRRMWAQSQAAKYIRKWADEKQAVYDIRRICETFFEGLGRVLSAAVGMLFAKPPQIDWRTSEAAMKPDWENLDNQGTAGEVLVKRFADMAVRDGLATILVDHPTMPKDANGNPITLTAEQEAAFGLHPRWGLYARAAAINWFDDTVQNKRILTDLILEEATVKRMGRFGVTAVRRYRHLTLQAGPAAWLLYEETKEAGQGGFRTVASGVFKNREGETRDTLPVAIAYTGRTTGPMDATIPLMGVAWANLAHWQMSTNLRFYRDLCAFPQAVVVGELAQELGAAGAAMPGKVRVGPMAVVHLKGDGATFDWKGPPTEAFTPLENGVKEKLEQIGQLGMAFLVSDTRAAETAAAKQLDATAENSTLSTARQGIQDAVNLALEIHAWFRGIAKADAPTITINNDFDNTVMDPQSMLAYVTAFKDAGLPIRLLLEAWQRGGRIPVDTDLDELEAEMTANAEAVAQQRAQAEADAKARGTLPQAA
jgi:hypothetical protein